MGYKQTKAGDIPEDWEVKRLEEFAFVIMGQSPVGSSYNKNGNGIALLNGPTEFTEKYPTKIQWTTSPTKFCEKGDILLCIRGSSTGRINISNDKYCIGRGVAAIRAKNNSANSFLEFQVQNIVDRILALTAGSTFPNIDGKSLRNIQIPLPPLAEQQAIAEALSDVDALIAALDRLIAKKRAIKQGAMQQLLTGQTRLSDFGEGQDYEQTKIGVIPEDWEVKPLKTISSMKGRIGWQGLKQTEFTSNPDDPFLITGMNFKDGEIRWDEVYHIPVKRYEEDPNIQLKVGDVLMTKDGTIGKLLYVNEIPYPGKASLNSHLLLFRPLSGQYFPKFLFYQLGSKTFLDYVELNKSGSTFFGITQEAVGNYVAFLPPIEEQHAIAQILSDIDAEIEALEQQRDKTKAIKQGMMQELLTGKTRLL